MSHNVMCQDQQNLVKRKHTLELLAPAKNLEIGIAAINAGADAVYIGGSAFGARAAAGNSLADLQKLCAYAHRFGAKVYVTLNTLLYDHELEQAQQLVDSLKEIGADALIVQDPAVLTFVQTKDIEVHASTQWNINSLDKVDSCIANNISQIVLPREFDLETIKHFCASRNNVRFEVFISGAMCVSVSGICYISELMTNRSANRGECAQICRLPMQLYKKANASNGQPSAQRDYADQLLAQGHLLSMKDNQRLDYLEALVLAKVSSFKIEGRLKEHDFVVNQVSAFNQRLNAIISKYPDLFVRASSGRVSCNFVPNLAKTFNRGFTNQYLLNDNSNLVDLRTPKSLGESMGEVISCAYEYTPNSNLDSSESKNRGTKASYSVTKDKFNGKQNKDSRAFSQSQKFAKNYRADKSFGSTNFKKADPIKSFKSQAKNFVIKFRAQKDLTLNNGDSFTFFDGQELSGFRSNRSTYEDFSCDQSGSLKVKKGQVVALLLNKEVPALKKGAMLYRNVDTFFIKQIQMPKATERKLDLNCNLHLKQLADQKYLFSVIFADQFARQGCASLILNESGLEENQIQQFNENINATLEQQENALKELNLKELLSESKLKEQNHDFIEHFKSLVSNSVPLEFFNANCPILQKSQMLDKITKLNEPTLNLEQSAIVYNDLIENVKLPLSIFNRLRRMALLRYLACAQLARVQALALNLEYLGKDPLAGTYQKPEHFSKWPESSVDPRLIQNQVTKLWYQEVLDPNAKPLSALNAKAVMTCRHCLVKSHALCKKEGGSTRGFYLKIGKHCFDIVCDCKACLMHLVPRD